MFDMDKIKKRLEKLNPKELKHIEDYSKINEELDNIGNLIQILLANESNKETIIALIELNYHFNVMSLAYGGLLDNISLGK